MAVHDEVPAPLVGSVQYPGAGDLSPYLIHLTRSAESLASILTHGRIEARNPFGLASKKPAHAQTHKAVCLTETPASELERFSARRFGVVFKRDFIQKLGGQRVWYIDYGSPLWDAFTHELNRVRALSENERFFEMTPFIDMVRAGTYAFDWEREWRVVGDVQFEWNDIEYLVTAEQGLLTFAKPEIGGPTYDHHDMTHIWSGGTLTELDDAMDALKAEFCANFSTPENHLSHDDESEDGYAWGPYSQWSSWEAIDSLFEDRPERVKTALEEHLNQVSFEWLSDDELNEPPEED